MANITNPLVDPIATFGDHRYIYVAVAYFVVAMTYLYMVAYHGKFVSREEEDLWKNRMDVVAGGAYLTICAIYVVMWYRHFK